MSSSILGNTISSAGRIFSQGPFRFLKASFVVWHTSSCPKITKTCPSFCRSTSSRQWNAVRTWRLLIKVPPQELIPWYGSDALNLEYVYRRTWKGAYLAFLEFPTILGWTPASASVVGSDVAHSRWFWARLGWFWQVKIISNRTLAASIIISCWITCMKYLQRLQRPGMCFSQPPTYMKSCKKNQ